MAPDAWIGVVDDVLQRDLQARLAGCCSVVDALAVGLDRLRLGTTNGLGHLSRIIRCLRRTPLHHRAPAERSDLVHQVLGVVLLIRDPGLQELPQLWPVWPCHLRRGLDMADDGVVFAGEIIVQAVNQLVERLVAGLRLQGSSRLSATRMNRPVSSTRAILSRASRLSAC